MADAGKFGIGKEQVNKVRVFFQKILVEALDLMPIILNYSECNQSKQIKKDKPKQKINGSISDEKVYYQRNCRRFTSF